MKLFDLHCDTLFRALEENKSLSSNDFHISINRGLNYSNWIQCFAVFIPDEYRNEDALDLFVRAKKKLDLEIKKNSKTLSLCKNKKDLEENNFTCKAILTVEGGALLAGKLSNLFYLHSQDVKMMTLTWNDKNEIGDGCAVSNPLGITDFGKSVLKNMEDLNMIIDISHASDNLFFDVANNTKKPFVASHSNSRKVFCHRRNLTDEQFNVIRSRGGLVGINFCKDFLNGKSSTMYDIIKHTEHFLSLGGENIISIGADFDGAVVPDEILGIQSMENLYELFLKHGYSETLVENIFFNNAYKFFINNCFKQ